MAHHTKRTPRSRRVYDAPRLRRDATNTAAVYGFQSNRISSRCVDESRVDESTGRVEPARDGSRFAVRTRALFLDFWIFWQFFGIFFLPPGDSTTRRLDDSRPSVHIHLGCVRRPALDPRREVPAGVRPSGEKKKIREIVDFLYVFEPKSSVTNDGRCARGVTCAWKF